MTTYTDGPADQPWEVGSDGDGWFVQRYGWSDRVAPIDAPTERLFYVDTEDHAHSLAARLNALDAVAEDIFGDVPSGLSKE